MPTLEELITKYEYMWTTDIARHGVLVTRKGSPILPLKFDIDGNASFVTFSIDRLAQIVMESLLAAGAKTFYDDEEGHLLPYESLS